MRWQFRKKKRRKVLRPKNNLVTSPLFGIVRPNLREYMISPILGFHHIAIITADYARSKQFYTKILGAEIIAETYRAARDSYKLDLKFADNSRIELFSFPNPPKRLSHPEACGLRHLALQVEDIQSTVNYLLKQGVSCEPIRIDELTGMQYTFFRDPDNLPLELYQIDKT